uniref:Uncharacterized protein n=1 Tax=Rhizophora mucronata TaxID=61149 RepID=A0A2P2IIG0_RHIMU
MKFYFLRYACFCLWLFLVRHYAIEINFRVSVFPFMVISMMLWRLSWADGCNLV